MTRRRLAQLALLLCAAVWLSVGAPGLLRPALLLEPVGVALEGPDASSEARALYGGLHLALGGLYLIAVVRPRLHRPLLGLWTLLVGGLVAGRLVSLAVDGPPLGLARVLLALEVLGLAAGAAVWRACPPAAEPERAA